MKQTNKQTIKQYCIVLNWLDLGSEKGTTYITVDGYRLDELASTVRAQVQQYKQRNSESDDLDAKLDIVNKVSRLSGNVLHRQSSASCSAALYNIVLSSDQSLFSIILYTQQHRV